MPASPGSSMKDLVTYLDANGLESHTLCSEAGSVVVVPAWGGRIEFLGTSDENAIWTPPDFAVQGDDAWNKGGARSWFSPEGGDNGIYFSDDWKTWQCPAQMDPGTYRVLNASPSRIEMENIFRATSNDGTKYHLAMGRDVELDTAPEDIADSVRCVSVHFAHSYKNLGTRTIKKEIDLWHLVQLRPEGTILVPLRAGDAKPFRNYFEPVPEDRVAVGEHCLSLRIDGARRYKLGVPAERATGHIGYLRNSGETASLILKRFDIAPDGTYADRPEAAQNTNGDPIQMYNHLTGGAEAFGEIECHSPASTLQPGHGQVFAIQITLLEGPRDDVLASGSTLLGIDLNDVQIW